MVETELSEQLQISRGTLREAMRQLQQEGLISAGARGRLSVRHLDAKEIRDIFAVRAALEAPGRQRTRRRDPTAPAAVAELRGAVDRHGPRAATNLEDRIEADLRLPPHHVPPTGNETLLHSWHVARRLHPDVDHVRRRRPGAGNMDVTATSRSSTPSSPATDSAADAVREHMAGAASVLVDGAL